MSKEGKKKKVSEELRLELRSAMARIKLINQEIAKPLKGSDIPKLKELDLLRNFIKTTSLEYGLDFDFPEGRTEMGKQVREGYDKGMLDEMIENGTIDTDTAQIILRARFSNEIPILHLK